MPNKTKNVFLRFDLWIDYYSHQLQLGSLNNMVISQHKEIQAEQLTPDSIIHAYRLGYFPMAEPDGKLFWYQPEMRAIFPLRQLKFSRSLRKLIRQGKFDISFNREFKRVMYHCAMNRRGETWISDEMLKAYTKMNELGFAHSIEVWENNHLVGGLYGVSLGGMFCGESMFNIVPNTAKIAFYYLVEQLNKQGYVLLDSQFINHFTEQLGAVEVPADLFDKYRKEALKLDCRFV